MDNNNHLSKRVLMNMGNVYYNGIKSTDYECIKYRMVGMLLTLKRGECGTITASLDDYTLSTTHCIINTYVFRNMSDFKELI